MLNLLILGIALGILITVHEFGHFLAARWFGVTVESFSIGFGPKVLSWQGKQTQYRLSLLPLGGYVKMQGENPDETDTHSSGSFTAKSWRARATIALAGPAANFVLALLVFVFTFWLGKTDADLYPVIGQVKNPQQAVLQQNDRILSINGKKVDGYTDLLVNTSADSLNQLTVLRQGKTLNLAVKATPSDWYQQYLPAAPAVIGQVMPGMPAFAAGLQPKDSVAAVNGIAVNDWYEFQQNVATAKGTNIDLQVYRQGKPLTINVKLMDNVYSDSTRVIGVTQDYPLKRSYSFGVWQGVKLGTLQTLALVKESYHGLFKLLTKPSELANNVGGPVMLYSMSSQTVARGLEQTLTLFAGISIILMMMNLLPIPVLDGGQIMFCLIEGARGKALSINTQGLLQRAGFLVLVGLMIFTFYSDITKVTSRQQQLHKAAKVIQSP